MSNKSLTILGATGTVGCNALNVLRKISGYSLYAITGANNAELLAQQALEFKPEQVVIANKDKYNQLKALLGGADIKVMAGDDAVAEVAAQSADLTINAIVGLAGLKPAYEVVKRAGVLATANKECLVSAGHILVPLAAKTGALILPVDSEHNAIYQMINNFWQADAFNGVEYITLTASGGPFRDAAMQQMMDATPEQAVKHPNWNMGAKISVDSATMMNKGLEVVEAHYLFNLHEHKIKVLVHPESIIHGMVHYHNGSTIMQASMPDMQIPLAYIMEKIAAVNARTFTYQAIDFSSYGALNFSEVDSVKFPALNICRAAINAGAGACIVLNAANEMAVAKFLNRQIGFLEITAAVRRALDDYLPTKNIQTIEDVILLDNEVRKRF